MKQLTVFTPTYNRKHLLPRLYESLKNQTDQNFIWLVIDDGSTDGTEELIKQWQKDRIIEILYFYKKNEGITPTRLLLTGIAVAAGISAVTIVMILKLSPEDYQFVAIWMAGSVWGSNWLFVLSIDRL